MPKIRSVPSLLALALAAGGCSLGDFYEREYVLYDGSTPAAVGSRERAAQDQLAADADRAPPAADADQAASVARIFVLENLRDELDRAIGAGTADVEALRRKRDDVVRELEWRSAEVGGEAVAAAREARLQRLLGFPVVVR